MLTIHAAERYPPEYENTANEFIASNSDSRIAALAPIPMFTRCGRIREKSNHAFRLFADSNWTELVSIWIHGSNHLQAPQLPGEGDDEGNLQNAEN